jgi:hypothetical protein
MNYKLIGFIFILLIIFSIIVLVTVGDEDSKTSTVTATDVLNDNLKDPVIVSRAYFTSTLDGPIGTFTGYPSSWAEDNRLHSFSHKKS